MALKAVHVSDVPNLDEVPQTPLSLYSSTFNDYCQKDGFKAPKFMVIGHRGHGMNVLHSSDRRMKAIKENTLLSFNAAVKHAVDFIEFDVQVTRDDCPVIFHDDFILSEQNGTVYEKRVTDLSLAEFLSFGPQRELTKDEKCLLRKTKDGKILNWNVETDDSLCTLQEAFQKVNPSLGFNVELKFDDHIVYQQDHLTHLLQVVLQVVFDHANERPVLFSSFHPDAALLARKLQCTYPVFFLTNGGNEIYHDARRNSLEEAIKLCLEGSLHGIVSEVRAIFRNPATINKIKESKLALITYGKLNNVPEATYLQHLMGVQGVIVDFVQEISEAVCYMIKPSGKGDGERLMDEDGGQVEEDKPQFSQRELSFLLKLIPELIQ